ncbi:MAG: GMC oxidoreductase [Acidobacteriota bacterium]
MRARKQQRQRGASLPDGVDFAPIHRANAPEGDESYCRLCAGYGCPTRAKGSSQVALIDRAEATGRCRIVPEAHVFEILMGLDGRAQGARYIDRDGVEHEICARVVCVCCSAVESARLLLLSTSPLFPDGLGNGSGLVGRHLQFHAVTGGRGVFRREALEPEVFASEHPFLNRSIADFLLLPEGVSDLPKGGMLRFSLPQLQPVAEAQTAAHGPRGGLLWGQELAQALRRRFLETFEVNFEVFGEFIPKAGTSMRLSDEVVDRFGLPVADLSIASDPHHQKAGAWIQQRAFEILDGMGAEETVSEAVGAPASFLVHGTCRAGADPATSVLDEFCRSHEVPNLFVVDGSFMPTSGGAAPTLTILANSFRTADHILEQSRRGEFS